MGSNMFCLKVLVALDEFILCPVTLNLPKILLLM